MPLYVEDIGKHLGKIVQDLHGRTVGLFVGLSTDDLNEVTDVQVEIGSGDLETYKPSQIRLIDGHPILIPEWKVASDEISRESDVISRKLHALDLLLRDGDIDKATYDSMKRQFENLHEELEKRKHELASMLKERNAKLDSLLGGLRASLTNNKMLFSEGEIGSNAYDAVVSSLRNGIKRASSEEEEISKVLASFDAVEPPKIEPQVGKLPEPPKPISIPDVVVVKVNENSPA